MQSTITTIKHFLPKSSLKHRNCDTLAVKVNATILPCYPIT